MALPGLSQLSVLVRAAASQFHWFALGAGVTASAVSAFVIAAQPSASFFYDGPDAGNDHTRFLRLQTGDAAQRADSIHSARLLAGISGEMRQGNSNGIAALELSPQRSDQYIAPVVWNELSDTANCLTVKTKAGETFSFRVLGLEVAKSSAATRADGSANLAIAPCADNGAFVEKALIEPDAASDRKEVLPARSL